VPTAAQEVVGNGAAHDLPSKTPWRRWQWLCERKRGEERNRTEERNEEEKGEK
jgi:hypothetical protein